MRVWRHLRDGDYVMVNRQPTLHRPSIMAHKVKVLKKQKTIRMHYANCNSYVGLLVLPTMVLRTECTRSTVRSAPTAAEAQSRRVSGAV